ncbi:50S ribosomal protein L11 methyltransferase [Mucilaginibacter ginkgonis]|uniref:Ribosomal protein L11 methyltransferase n=1 Tax=Mucilaginibacter ginkgonis TaxID=2682091 RepID=A0A6I4IP14_9SPHI|nr:50S ribosomal protein L11 methyltransferase [Mucilaginibacter ginkgonis]QQL48372.1 50S ribosomal protein L11 methyltransferase [Mucilaginibacter ginkgonis]
MDYYELVFTLQAEEYQKDLVIAALADLGFDTFEETDNGFKAYIPIATFNNGEMDTALAPFLNDFSFGYEVNLIPQTNWNKEWESNFSPMTVGDKVRVRATFHEPDPAFEHEIIIDPKMAFGTGHHETTTMMMAHLLKADLTDKTVLDMGAGTAILAILAAKLGAKEITAIDNDPVCYDSSIENSRLNDIDNIISICGSKEAIPDKQFDVILANINRNILVDQMQRYAKVLKHGGEIYFSGFYESPDLDIIKSEAAKYKMHYIAHKKMKDWVAAKFVKTNYNLNPQVDFKDLTTRQNQANFDFKLKFQIFF